MGWRDFFSEVILKRGLDLYKKKRVLGFSRTDDSAIARVADGRNYQVTVWYRDEKLAGRCNCESARNGRVCKHMAAVLFQWEADKYQCVPTLRQKKALQPEVLRAEDALDPADRKELYFNLIPLLKDYTVSADSVKSAREQIADDEITPDNREFFYAIGQGYQSRFYGHMVYRIQEKNGKTGSVELQFTKNAISILQCSCCNRRYHDSYYYSNSTRLCSHAMAAIIDTDRYLLLYNPGDATDVSAAQFLERVGRKRAIEKKELGGERKKTIVLEPRVFMEYSGLELSFKIGNTKMYVLKDMTDLVDKVEKRETLQLGTKSAISFATDTFVDSSLPFYRLIRSEVRLGEKLMDQMLSKQAYYFSGRDLLVKNRIILSGSGLDRFYTQELGKDVPVAGGDAAVFQKLKIRETAITIPVVISASGKGKNFDGVLLKADTPELLQGEKENYLLDGDVMTRIPEEQYRELEPLLEMSDEDGIPQMKIGKKKMPEFFYRVLPEMEKNPCLDIRITDEKEIQKHLAPEAQFVFRLDAEDGQLLCRAEVAYGDKKHVLRLPEPQELPLPAYRDLNQEQDALEQVHNYFPEYSEQKEAWCSDSSADQVFRVLTEGTDTLLEYGEVEGTEAFRRQKIRTMPTIQVGVGVESDLMNLSITTDDMSLEELAALLDSYRKKKKYYRLKSGEFIRLEESGSLDVLQAMMDSMGVSVKEFTKGKMHLPLYRALYLDKMLEEHDELASDRDHAFRELVKNFKTIKDSDFSVPASLKKIMRNYQVYGYKWMRTLAGVGFSGILADDMGLGKTLQMISVLLADKLENAVPHTSLIVCPASLVYNWQEELQRFAPELKTIPVTGTAAARRDIIEGWQSWDVMITSYDLLKRDISHYEDKTFFYHVLDEAQFIKNPKAGVSKAVKVIHSRHRMALTGTPIENRLSELWSIFDFLMPGFLYDYAEFHNRYENPITREKDEEAAGRLKRMVGPFILRRLKGDVLKDLPEKIEEVRYAKFDTEQQHLYDAQVAHMTSMLESGELNSGKDKIRILAELTKIRQLCCDPSLILENYSGGSAKREAVLDLIRSAMDGGHRMLVFSQFTSMLELLEEDLKKENISYYKITGSTPKEERIRLVHAFNENSTPVFLISLKAGGTGLNLVGADMVIHYDPWWNLAAQNQATDRAHRIGQKHKVSVFKLIAKNTIEEKILKLQEAKKDLADAIISGEGESLTSLTAEELVELLQG
jgi:superfamily II DNA or RNA helicase